MNADIDHTDLIRATGLVGTLSDCASWYTREVAEKLASQFPDKPVLELTLENILSVTHPKELIKLKPVCSTRDCGEPGAYSRSGVWQCGFCHELENNRRYRQHNSLGEYAREGAQG